MNTSTAVKSANTIFQYIYSIIACMQPTCITLFAGVGGSSLGAFMAGFKELLAIDFDHIAKRNFELNFKDEHYVPFWDRDIWEVTPTDILKSLMLEAGQLCLLLITAPCQGFSEASGKFNPLDKRNALFLRGIDFVKELLPLVAIFENVPGMLHKYHTPIMNEIKLRLTEELPQYRVFCFKVNALFFGVPSDRYRLFFFCIRTDIFIKEPDLLPVTPDISAFTIGNIAPNIQQIEFGQSKKIIRLPHEFMPTITATEGIRYREGGEWFKLGENEEYLRKFQSFPDNFILEGTPKQKCKLIGNAVPPMLMFNILSYVKHEILCFPKDDQNVEITDSEQRLPELPPPSIV